MNATSPKSSLAKLGLYPRQKSLKVMVLGQSGIGKTAMVVRFTTKRYIGDYDPTLEKVYAHHTVIDNEMMYFDILDTAGQPHVWSVFRDVCRFWRVHSKNPTKLRRTASEKEQASPDTSRLYSTAISPSTLIPQSIRPTGTINRRWTEVEEEEEAEKVESQASSPNDIGPFRGRASTDGHLQQRPWRWRYPPPNSTSTEQVFSTTRAERRMSISMRGNKASY
ncbi:unnamed protein product [Brassicogethes aeneus]|uniref:small monomeric GTPase n=1 Tax=Brassicogethes aeneus TaxID=1431903 RepID=A0A9P0FGH5_BRAAE|nr:unnamed protein product [Brassicogethes aeneus]